MGPNVGPVDHIEQLPRVDVVRFEPVAPFRFERSVAGGQHARLVEMTVLERVVRDLLRAPINRRVERVEPPVGFGIVERAVLVSDHDVVVRGHDTSVRFPVAEREVIVPVWHNLPHRVLDQSVRFGNIVVLESIAVIETRVVPVRHQQIAEKVGHMDVLFETIVARFRFLQNRTRLTGTARLDLDRARTGTRPRVYARVRTIAPIGPLAHDTIDAFGGRCCPGRR